MLSSLGVVNPFDRQHRLVTSPFFSPRLLAFQRLLLVVYGCTTLLTSLVYESVILRQGNIWFSFFTHLTFIGLIAFLLVSAYHGLKYKPSPLSSFAYPLQRWHKSLQAMHLLLMSTVTTFPILVTICFWAFLASADTFKTRYETWSAVSLHILNSVFVLLEVTTSNIPPLPWVALPVCLVILLVYLGMNYITYLSQGVYVYPFLDPQKQGTKLAAYIFGIAIGEVLIFVLVRYAIVLRDKLCKFALYHDDHDTQHGEKKEVPQE